MAAQNELAPAAGRLDTAYVDEAGRPLGAYLPSTLVRLNRLHNEAVETARLANLLGRVPLAAAALGAGCVTTLLASSGEVAASMLAFWATFIAAGIATMLRIRNRAHALPFELLPLRAFAQDLNAVMLYVGFAWGAGAFLGLAPAIGTADLVLFALGAAAAVGAVLRARNATLYFLCPNIALAAASASFNGAGIAGSVLIVTCGLLVIALTEGLERIAARRTYAPVLSPFTLP